ncbi:MAG TPA: hypothetical protein VF622_01475 [Segetibacter sp.]
MKKIAFSVAVILLTTISYSQDSQLEYSNKIKNADSLIKLKDYKGAAREYSKAFEAMAWKGKLLDRYNAACCWALAGVSDSAFFQLYKMATFENMPYKNYDHITTDSDLLSLHNDKRWQPLLEMIRKNKEKAEASGGTTQ